MLGVWFQGDWICACVFVIPPIQLLMSAAAPATTCCESGRPVVSDPHTGQAVCCPPLDTRAALLHSARVSGLPAALYSSPYAAAAAEQGYVHFAADPSAFYSPLVSVNLKIIHPFNKIWPSKLRLFTLCCLLFSFNILTGNYYRDVHSKTIVLAREWYSIQQYCKCFQKCIQNWSILISRYLSTLII